MLTIKIARILSVAPTFAAVALCASALVFAADGYKNLGSPPGSAALAPLAPGQTIYLPDGRGTSIAEVLPDGNFKTPEGFVISPQGVLQNGPDQGATITVTPNISGAENAININIPPAVQGYAGPDGEKTALPDDKGAAKTPDAVLVPEKEKGVAPDEKGKNPDFAVAIPTAPDGARDPAMPDKPDAKSEDPQDLTLAQMLPLTRADGSKPKAAAPNPGEKNAKPAQAPEKDKGANKGEGASQGKGAGKGEGQGKGAAQAPKAEAKPKAGQPIRIPESAIKSGNLSFLEGCWEGTRPEYISKRTVKECFCFGKDGKTGKRRIYDRTYGRTCVGPSRANLSKNGVLSVTSGGMPCSDGEKWGGAEMQCRNSGPKTPCSWIFTDAGNGRQAYEIPFLRVNSCGR
ncbi:MAG: hypothetical protein K2H64_00835 [Desulfovibrio sp.]|nr:hypothetical protein [Desulfovibrio sp.]